MSLASVSNMVQWWYQMVITDSYYQAALNDYLIYESCFFPSCISQKRSATMVQVQNTMVHVLKQHWVTVARVQQHSIATELVQARVQKHGACTKTQCYHATRWVRGICDICMLISWWCFIVSLCDIYNSKISQCLLFGELIRWTLMLRACARVWINAEVHQFRCVYAIYTHKRIDLYVQYIHCVI